MQVTPMRCHCCGVWQFVTNWNNKQPTYCDHCRAESDPAWRTGPGRGQCQACKMYPASLQHWQDPKPTTIPYIHIYIR